MIKTVTINPSLDRFYNVEHIELDALHRVIEISDYPGGKGINMARVLKELNTESVVYGFIGGSTGDALSSLCSELNTQLIRIANQTRVNHKYRDLSDHNITEFNEYGPFVSDKEFKILEHCLSRDVFDDEWVMLGGSSPRGLSDDVYIKLENIIHHRYGKVLLCCDMPWLKKGIEGHPEVVKVNLDELSRLAGHSFNSNMDIVNYLKNYIDDGIELFIVSMADKGAIFVDNDQAIIASVGKVNVVNDVGAGDAMLAGIVKCLVENKPLEELASYCVACATAAILSNEISVTDEENVKKFQQLVRIEKVV